jgi:hypothetical protein
MIAQPTGPTQRSALGEGCPGPARGLTHGARQRLPRRGIAPDTHAPKWFWLARGWPADKLAPHRPEAWADAWIVARRLIKCLKEIIVC